MPGALLVLNAGSSSLKFSLFIADEPPRLWVRGQYEALSNKPRFVAHREGTVIAMKDWAVGTGLGHADAIEHLLAGCQEGLAGEHSMIAVGHRVVHGGARFSGAVRIDASVLAELEALIPLAPLHQPHCVAAIKAVTQRAPSVAQVACFD